MQLGVLGYRKNCPQPCGKSAGLSQNPIPLDGAKCVMVGASMIAVTCDANPWFQDWADSPLLLNWWLLNVATLGSSKGKTLADLERSVSSRRLEAADGFRCW